MTQSVRDAARQVNTNLKRVEATRKARELAEQRLEADEKRFAVGLATTFQLLQAQRDLARAQAVGAAARSSTTTGRWSTSRRFRSSPIGGRSSVADRCRNRWSRSALGESQADPLGYLRVGTLRAVRS